MQNPTENLIESLVAEINELLRANIDSSYVKKIKQLVPSGKTIIGVRVPVIKELVRNFKQSKDLKFDLAFNLLDTFFERQTRDEILFGIFLLQSFKKSLNTNHFAKIDEWVDQIENWEVCDQLAANIAAEIVAEDLTLIDELVRWTNSNNFWRRRFALAVTTALNQKGRSHVPETLKICEKLMNDQEAMVQKAVGWALREASKKDEKQVFEFLCSWKDKAPSRIIKESSEKLSSGFKNKLLD